MQARARLRAQNSGSGSGEKGVRGVRRPRVPRTYRAGGVPFQGMGGSPAMEMAFPRPGP